MSINATLLAQALVFAILVWFTMKFVWPMLQAAMKEREGRIADGLAAAERGKNDLVLAEKRSAEQLRQAKEQAHTIIEQARRQANELVEQSKEDARGEAEKVMQSARSQIDQERTEAREGLRKDVAVLAIAGAEQILRREVDAAAHGELLDQLATQL